MALGKSGVDSLAVRAILALKGRSGCGRTSCAKAPGATARLSESRHRLTENFPACAFVFILPSPSTGQISNYFSTAPLCL